MFSFTIIFELMQPLQFENITIDRVDLPVNPNKIEVSVLRLDKIHPVISGNKWFKLQYYINEAKQLDKTGLLTFGGAWSNHIIATAAAAAMNGLQASGIIRGEEPAVYSPTLMAASELGMRLYFTGREAYSNKEIPAGIDHASLLLIPEGGYGPMGALGAASISNYFNRALFTHICCAVGTGTMLAGLINSSPARQQLVGISVMKNNHSLETAVRALLNDPARIFTLLHDHHEGGYAKHSPRLLAFMNDWMQQTGIPSDFVYTAKLFLAISQLASNGYFPVQSRLLLIHSGGLQGNASLAASF
jgi:1-aminocyclopropane-1-carboxylate deaminase